LEFNWRPGIGDPTIGGWVTVVLYFAACISCWKTAGVVRHRDGHSDNYAWRAISVSCFALGINKQLDLQSALTDLGRILAYSGGWYEQRQTVQVYFIIGIAILCLIAALILVFWARKSSPQTWLAIVGSMFVLGFVLIRAASFHHIDRFIGSRILGLKWNWVLEMGGISMVLLGSELRRAQLGHPQDPKRSISK
jgi:ABC-type Mn2+/Zn2+ transport system permease subunit